MTNTHDTMTQVQAASPFAAEDDMSGVINPYAVPTHTGIITPVIGSQMERVARYYKSDPTYRQSLYACNHLGL